MKEGDVFRFDRETVHKKGMSIVISRGDDIYSPADFFNVYDLENGEPWKLNARRRRPTRDEYYSLELIYRP
jgi:hypothetical protein